MIPTIYRGSVKDLLGPIQSTSSSGEALLLFQYTDAFSVFDWGRMPDPLPLKGEALTILAAYFFEKLEKFEEQSVQAIVFNMIKWFGFDRVTVETEVRNNVESSVWITVKIEWEDGKHSMHITGQRNDIVQRRLSEFMKEHLRKQREGN